MRIKSWHMSVRTHKELVPRTVVGMQQDPTMLEQLSKNITRQGITNSTLNYLRVRIIIIIITLFFEIFISISVFHNYFPLLYLESDG